VPSLLDLVARGRVGAVEPGSPEHLVRDALGPPPTTSIKRDPIIWKYEALEVTLVEGSVELLHVELDQPLPAFLDPEGLTAETTIEAFKRLLDQARIAHEPFPPLSFEPDQIALSTGQGQAVAIFADEKLAVISSRARF
jgi:hypothetical protein